ncbi:hypothetical protein GIB67_017566 [Kingdonia uniflora]|uniref:Kinesin motor domain-containing protein n=1 Tax=Kingdonia uniflora TaxID=39325 RepID=A0A7J7LN31_9MAGN|nr:hypothetical protein GIB67_017566 [Kingdonia uniflora]
MEASEDCCVKVAVHIRPLIGDEKAQGCKDCITVVTPKPQVQIGSRSFTFDHVYGSYGSPSSSMFEECVAPLVDGLFQGYNATVLAYGQTGSGKTYTMGTGYRDGGQTGVVPQVMNALFSKIETLKHEADFQLHVSFIEYLTNFFDAKILKEEVRDLLEPTYIGKSEISNGHAGKVTVHGKPPIQIRETSNGVITLAGLTEVGVSTLKEMASCLDQGSLSRATGSTNMNNQSSRSHAIFTITLEQIRRFSPVLSSDSSINEDISEDFLCAKLHLVDLAGSERAKRTGSDGVRFKEGVHINKGLLALGNVISALGDEKKRKEGMHVPYRDSKLTRLLQDSLGGNSRTVMIACISPADINAEETLNTLKYANRARNIQNKLVVNRDPISNEVLRMRQQLEYLQSELLFARGGGASSDEVQILKERIVSLESANQDLCRELHEFRNRYAVVEQCEAEEGGNCFLKNDRPKRCLQNMDSDYQMAQTLIGMRTPVLVKDLPCVCVCVCVQTKVIQVHNLQPFSTPLISLPIGFEMEPPVPILMPGDNPKEVDDDATKEWEHTVLQNNMDKELNELNRRLEQKESEMKLFGGLDTTALKQHFGKKVMELEDEKRTAQQERNRLLAEVENLAATSDGQTQKMQDIHTHKLKALETQILDLKRKQESQVQNSKQKPKSDEATKRLQDEIQFIKAQKVQLQNKIKQEAEQFRQWKACREKELLQLRKEGRRSEYERHKLQALNQRQKMVTASFLHLKFSNNYVLQRKTEEAAMATKRLKELLEARKSSVRDSSGNFLNLLSNEKSLQRWLDHELEVMVNVHEVRLEYEKQSQVRAALAEQLAIIKHGDDATPKDLNPSRGKNGYSRVSSMSPNSKIARIASLENMLGISSNTLVAMASQLSEAEERERAFTGRGRWNQLRTMGDAKNLLQYMFSVAADARCQLWEKEVEMKERRQEFNELVSRLRQSEARRKEIEKQQKLREQAVAIALATSASGNSHSSLKHFADDTSGPLSPVSSPAQKQLKYTAGVANGSVRHSKAVVDQTRKFLELHLRCAKKIVFTVSADGTYWAVVNGETAGLCWTSWKALEMEKESPSMVIAIQVEMAETMETLRVDQTQ